jgi:hypothetical protein
MNWYVLGLGDHPAAFVKKTTGAVSSFLNVRRIGTADQYGAHLLGYTREGTDEDR